MANTLTALAPVLFSAARVVAEEPVGALGSISMNFDDKGVALGDSIVIPDAPVAAETDYSAAMTTTGGTDKIAGSVAVTIQYSKQTSWNLTGEQIRSLQNAQSDKEWAKQMVAQGMRTLRNAAEVRLCAAITAGASRACGTAGTTPFASSLDAIADVQKIMLDNGAPMADPYLIINTKALNNAEKLTVVQQAYAAGSDQERRQGIIGNQYGFRIKASAGVQLHTNGAGTGYQANGALTQYGVTLALDSGTVNTTGLVAGDVIRFGTGGGSGTGADYDTNYVINTGLVATSGNIVISRPGMLVARVDNDVMTTQGGAGGTYTPNIAFERNAIVGIMRPPLIPASPLINQLKISDDKGLTYLLCEVVGDGMITWRLHLCYGFKVINGEFVAILMG